MLKLMGKKIFTILRSKDLFILTYVTLLYLEACLLVGFRPGVLVEWLIVLQIDFL